jgi:hypothetical protein
LPYDVEEPLFALLVVLEVLFRLIVLADFDPLVDEILDVEETLFALLVELSEDFEPLVDVDEPLRALLVVLEVLFRLIVLADFDPLVDEILDVEEPLLEELLDEDEGEMDEARELRGVDELRLLDDGEMQGLPIH